MKFILTILILFISTTAFSFNIVDIRKKIDKAIKKCSNCPKNDIIYENCVEMKKILSSVKIIGNPKIITFNNKPALYMSALFDKNKELIDVIYFNYKTHSSYSWPVKIIEDTRIKKFTPKSWNEYSTKDETFLDSYFNLPNENVNSEPFLFPCIEGNINRRLLGIPFKKIYKKKAFFIKGIDKYFKNMHETEKRINYLNKKYKTKFKILKGKRNTPFKCFFYAVSYISDWWNIYEGKQKIIKYNNFFNGNIEYGLDPRKLEALYFKLSKKYPEKFSFINSFLFKDGVTSEPLAKNLESVCSLLDNKKDYKLTDPIIKKINYKISKNELATELKHIKICETGINNEEKIISALYNYGPLLSGLLQSYNGIPLNIPTHAIVICGYIRTYLGTLFIYKEGYGKHSANFGCQNNGDVSFRMLPAEFLFQVFAYPHKLRAYINRKRNSISISFKNWKNIIKKVDELYIYDNKNNKLNFSLKNNKYYLIINKDIKFPLTIKWSKKYYGNIKNKYSLIKCSKFK